MTSTSLPPDTRPRKLFDDFDETKHNRDGHTGDNRLFFPDMLAYMDKLIGNVVDRLEKHDLRDKTLIVVMGDNGTKEPFTHVLPDGSRYPGGKGGNTDNGLHVPLILSLPGKIPAGKAKAIRSYGGVVDVTDIFPTLCQATGVAIPNPAAIDGISFWSQALGAKGEPRQVVYTWYNGNSPSTDLTKTLRYAFNKEFKRYAPHANFPKGRFFDLRNDPLEMADDRKVKVAWAHYHRSGLDIDKLDARQRVAYKHLGKVIESHRHVPVSALRITSKHNSIAVGTSVALQCRVLPAKATRQNVIWESSNPSMATVDKFGVLKAHAPGTVKIKVYSWDDAYPISANATKTYSRYGIQDSIKITIAKRP